ncbi:MAG: hypothetical protein AABZ80_10485 [Gemmatimonadota bacterium]
MPSIVCRPRALLVALAAIAAIGGCKDVTGPKAQFNNLEAKPTLYAMNGTAVTLPVALVVRSVTPVRIDATFIFDIAVDLDASGVVQVHSVSRVASELVATRRVGMQIGSESFVSTLKAPTGGYAYDTVMALPIGKTLLIDVLEQNCTSSFLGANIRAKVGVDSVNTTTRAIYLHVLSNPNCGFRALNQGEPKD